jgi:hypothetical protein
MKLFFSIKWCSFQLIDDENKLPLSTHGLLCLSRAVCLHTDCCARVERYVYTRTGSTRAHQSVCRHTALLGRNSPCVDIPLYSSTTVVCRHTALRGYNSPCLHTDCCTRVDRYVYTRLLCSSRAVFLHTDCWARVERYVSVFRHTALLGHNSPCVDVPLYSGTTVRV